MDINVVDREVHLEDGEKVVGDVLVGADGEFGLCRRVIVGYEDRGRLIGTAFYE